jgi:hypothetical protein
MRRLFTSRGEFFGLDLRDAHRLPRVQGRTGGNHRRQSSDRALGYAAKRYGMDALDVFLSSGALRNDVLRLTRTCERGDTLLAVHGIADSGALMPVPTLKLHNSLSVLAS